MSQHPRAAEPVRKPYRAPVLIVHGRIEAVTQTGPTRKQEKHPLDFKKGSKIRP